LVRLGFVTRELERIQGGELLAAISNAMVRLRKEHAGKGPTEAKTYWAGDDMLIVLMGGGYTAAEETLYQEGRGDTVRHSRQAFQDVLEGRMREIIGDLARASRRLADRADQDLVDVDVRRLADREHDRAGDVVGLERV